MRYAIYYTPADDDPLTRAAARSLGRSPFTGKTFVPRRIASVAAGELARFTVAPRRYGFHATLMAPFTLAEGESETSLSSALAAFCEGLRPIEAPRLVISRLDGFLALTPENESPGIQQLAADVIVAFDRFRAPLDDTEFARRSSGDLSPSQHKNLAQWGYPHMFEDFRFHMTLSGRLEPNDIARLERAAEAYFGPLLEEPLEVGSLALFCEPAPGAPFEVCAFETLGPNTERKIA